MFEVDYLPTLPSLLMKNKRPLIHRDVSWLQFNERVLDEARQTANPLIERAKFLAITSSNLDEFFMIRVASIERNVHSHQRKLDWPEYRRHSKIRSSLLEEVAHFGAAQAETFDLLAGELDARGIHLVRNLSERTPETFLAKQLFEQHVLPKLPPPESFVMEKLGSLENLQAAVIFPGAEMWLRVPRTLPPMLFSLNKEHKRAYFFFLDDLLSAFLAPTVLPHWKPGLVRLTRDADFSVDLAETDPESIPDVVMTRLGSRERGRPIRLQYSGDLSDTFLSSAIKALKLSERHVFPAANSLFLHGLWTVVNNVPDDFDSGPSKDKKANLKYPPLHSVLPDIFQGNKSLFDSLRERDFLLHHPYDSFEAYVEWVRQAAADPDVTRIEQTVYRTDALSPVMDILKKAAKKKRVGVVIELRARFDELNNLRLADELQKAGVEVAFGFGQLKLHAKVALVTRKENGVEKHYTHLSTGNYNAATARVYTDLALLTSHSEIGIDARNFFDSVWRGEVPHNFKQLVVAPTRLARKLTSLIQMEAEAARQGKKSRIVAKMNALVDAGIIESLYQASQAGVQVDLIVRGACSLIPGIKGLSENIRVVSVVDRFLEHSRIYYFEHSRKMYFSSADWMPRNLFSRLEIAFPVLDERIYKYVEEVIIPAYLRDTAKARELTPQGTWKKRTARGTAQPVRAQVLFREYALRGYKGTPLE